MSTSAPPRELELKLEVSPSDTAALKMHSFAKLGAQPNGTEHLVSVYYDTLGQDLGRHGVSLRVRHIGSRRVQTVKTAEGPAGGGIFDRAEWETELAGDEPNLEGAADSPLGRLLKRAKTDVDKAPQLRPLFQSEIERTTWIVARDSMEVEIALDEGRMKAGSRSCPVFELEFELKRGSAADLFTLVNSLEDVPVPRIGVLSKSERGYALADGSFHESFKAEPISLRPEMSTAEAFQAIARNCLRQFRLNEPILLRTRSVAALHQSRVALRRLRSALSLFQAVVLDERIDSLKDDLRDASRRLGEARNLDVFSKRVASEPTVTNGGGAAPRSEPLDALLKRREAAYDDVVALLESQAFRRLMLELLQWIEAGPWRGAQEPFRAALLERPIGGFAADVLETWRRKVVKKGRRLDALEPEERHRVRIAAKKLRYAAEFFAGLLHGEKEKHRHAHFLDAMETLQDALGDLNDMQIGHEIARDLLGADKDPSDDAIDPRLRRAVSHLSAVSAVRSDATLREALHAHERLADAKRFWRRWQS